MTIQNTSPNPRAKSAEQTLQSLQSGRGKSEPKTVNPLESGHTLEDQALNTEPQHQTLTNKNMPDQNNYHPARRNVSITSKEAKRFKLLGNMGEKLAETILQKGGFTDIVNLNHVAMNFPFADFIAEKEGVKYLISVKARNKFEHTGVLNSRFKLGDTDKKLEKLQNDEKFSAYNGHVPAWMAIALEKHTYEAYWGLIDELPNKRGISMSEKAKQNYRCLAKDQPHGFDFDEFGNIFSKTRQIVI